jgi:hypothetical protein
MHPTSSSRDRLVLGARWPLVLAAFAIGGLVAALGIVDQRRAAAQLRELERRVCDIPAGELPLAAIERLAAQESPGNFEANAVVQGLSGIAGKGATAELFYEAKGTVWSASGWGGSLPTGPAKVPKELGPWSALRAAEGCRGHRTGREQAVARSLRSPSGTPVLLVFRWWRGSD